MKRALVDLRGIIKRFGEIKQDLAASFHQYFNLGTKMPENRIVSRDNILSQARLLLAEGVRTVLHNGLNLLGINAPEKM